jgi:hypothetical protein
VDLSFLVRLVFQGTRVQVTDARLPAGANISAGVSVRDLAGFTGNGGTIFSTAANPDTTPPAMESISPQPGTTLFAGANDFVVRFSEPVTVSSQIALFAAGGQAITPRQTTYPPTGDGRTITISFDLPPNVSGTLNLLSGIVDLSGNPLAPLSLPYSTGPAQEFTLLQVLSTTPADTSFGVPLDSGIEFHFNQPVNSLSISAATTVWNEGTVIPVSLTSDAEGKVWRATPSAPWREKSIVAVEISTAIFGVSGALMPQPFRATFHTAAASLNDSPSNGLAAITASPDAVDIRFAEPRANPPEEPFGLRLGQQRVPARVERVGQASFRITPDSPLDPARTYHLMAGPEVEIPLRFRPPALQEPGR